MKASKIFAVAATSGLLGASLITVPALAWHPKGIIKKYVQNQTTGSQIADADTAGTAISARTGDILKYTIEVKNIGATASNGYNDMHFTKLTDTLPSGVELVSNPVQRTITEDLGQLAPGQSITKEYLVKVTAAANTITNTACFTGNSKVKDAPQDGCDSATVTVTPPSVVPPVIPPAPAELPKTGTPVAAGATVAGLIGIFAYAVTLYRKQRT